MKQLALIAIAFSSVANAILFPSTDLLSTISVLASSKEDITEKLHQDVTNVLSVPKRLFRGTNFTDILSGLGSLNNSAKKKLLLLALLVETQNVKPVLRTKNSPGLTATAYTNKLSFKKLKKAPIFQMVTNNVVIPTSFVKKMEGLNGVKPKKKKSKKKTKKEVQRKGKEVLSKDLGLVTLDQVTGSSRPHAMKADVYADQKEFFEAMKLFSSILDKLLREEETDSESDYDNHYDQDSDKDSDDEYVHGDYENDYENDTENEDDIDDENSDDDCNEDYWYDAYGLPVKASGNRKPVNATQSSKGYNSSNSLGWKYSTLIFNSSTVFPNKMSSGSYDFIHSSALLFAAVIALL